MQAPQKAAASGQRPIVFLHVGTPKSGTTYLQSILWRHREELLDKEALCYPGECYESHYLAALDLQRRTDDPGPRPDAAGAWDRLVAEVRRTGGNAVISHELLSCASVDDAARALGDLSFAEVHLVLTVRDLARQIPAAWQEEIKNGQTLPFGDYLPALREPARAPDGVAAHADRFWLMQDAAGILRRWAGDLPPGRVHVVTVPRPGTERDRLWRRFSGVLGVVPEAYDVAGAAGNESLGAAEAALVRRLNIALGGGLDQLTYDRVVKFCLANQVLGHRSDKLRFELPAAELPWVTARADAMTAELRDRGYDIVGDLAELLPGGAGAVPPSPPGSAPRPHPDRVADGAVLEAALGAIVGLAGDLMETRDRLAEAYEELDETRRALWAAFDRPLLRRAIHRLAYWFPPLRPLLHAGVFLRDRVIRRRAPSHPDPRTVVSADPGTTGTTGGAAGHPVEPVGRS